MNKIKYTNLLNNTLKLYEEKGSLEAYKYITENKGLVIGYSNEAQIYNYRYALAGAAGLEKEALQIMKEAILDKGYWYSYDYLIEDDDIKSLHKYDDFQNMINICKDREQQAKKLAKSEIKIIDNSVKDTDDKTLIVALHGNQENIEITEEYWRVVVTTNNNILALPQSSQIQVSDGYVWYDVQKGSNELMKHYEDLLKEHNVGINNIIVGGFSAGAGVVLDAVLNDKILVKGLILVAPWLSKIDEWKSKINKLKQKDIKVYVVCGDKDGDCFECTQKFIKLLDEENISYKYKLIKNLEHAYPENFVENLKDALSYIKNSDKNFLYRDYLNDLGWEEFFQKQFIKKDQSLYPAKVIAQYSGMYTVRIDNIDYNAKISGKFRYTTKQIKDYPVVGDWVLVKKRSNSKQVIINDILTRKNYFSRKMPISGGRKIKNGMIDGGLTEEQVLVSNIDTVMIVCGLDSNLNIARIERYLTIIEHNKLSAVILLNKSDLCSNTQKYIEQIKSISNKVAVIALSAKEKTGLEEVYKYIKKGKTLVFVGSSGVGKSTLLNALFKSDIQKTSETSTYSSKGVHTTTSRKLFFHPSGCMIVDTPGIKELQLWAEDDDINNVFNDIIELEKQCKFSNCTHKSEPGCAIKEAIDNGTLDVKRYDRYLTQLRELKRLQEKKKEYVRRKNRRK
ncbi:ribosome small subunit-dependent GTPase A [Abyssisolibacter fermentans]|uniref:ribosome small subunit-dependent GTPase A n=1 Tax=Abyssisolibacter fermentans TaxID=1766203 RepID=UPI0009E8F16E|nr:ribosome small subunit-dependent GTPase A [Abyssisolibacter fermentans]